MMEIKKNIARILLVVSVMFTIIFQLVHTYEHIESTIAYENEHASHDQCMTKTTTDIKDFQWKEHHQQMDHCFACDFILNTAILPSSQDFDLTPVEVATKVQDEVILHFIPLSHVYYSLRAPPALV